MCHSSFLSWLVAILTLWLVPVSARAQMFGNRMLGNTLSRRLGPGSNSAGTLSGNERFLRENRAQNAFVGTSLQDRREFVGVNQADGTRRRPSLVGRQAPTSERRSRRSGLAASPAAPRAASNRTKIYDPRLQIAFPVLLRTSEELRVALSERLTRSGLFPDADRIEVWVEDQTAILRGEVDERQDAVLAELLVRFEPGIDRVRNELTVAPIEPRHEPLPTPDSQFRLPPR